jgi:predicted GNAT superfamily acetyltransferase
MSSHTKDSRGGILNGRAPDAIPTSPGTDDVEIEELHGAAGAREVEHLQLAIWGSNESWIVPSHVLLIVSDYGGILLGARIDGELAGFVLGFLAQQDRRYFHASHMLGVLPTCQQRGIGAALKRQQREQARAQGLDLMTWTFDPLESRNAYFNLHKLGADSRAYRQDYYGPMEDALNRDLPSDRLLVEWDLSADGSRPSLTASPRTILHNRGGIPELRLGELVPGQPLAIEIPRDVQTLKHQSPDVAMAWRLAVREAFSMALSRGYQAHDFLDGAYILVPTEDTAG